MTFIAYAASWFCRLLVEAGSRGFDQIPTCATGRRMILGDRLIAIACAVSESYLCQSYKVGHASPVALEHDSRQVESMKWGW
jgi:hypothetical protein